MERIKAFLFLLLSGVIGFSCTEVAETRSLVNILLIDAPGDFDEVWIEVNGVDILPSGSRGSETNANWVNIPYQAASNMVLVSELVNDTRLLVGRDEIQSGDISKIRLDLGEVAYLVKDGNRIDMGISPAAEDLLELDVAISIESGFSYDIFLDLDLSQSIIAETGGSFTFEPKLRAFLTNGLGNIQGQVFPLTAPPYIVATTAIDTMSTLTADDGGFLLKGLFPDDYQIKIAAPPGYQDTTFSMSSYPDSTLTLSRINLRPSEP
jgi:hypothetical protein